MLGSFPSGGCSTTVKVPANGQRAMALNTWRSASTSEVNPLSEMVPVIWSVPSTRSKCRITRKGFSPVRVTRFVALPEASNCPLKALRTPPRLRLAANGPDLLTISLIDPELAWEGALVWIARPLYRPNGETSVTKVCAQASALCPDTCPSSRSEEHTSELQSRQYLV